MQNYFNSKKWAAYQSLFAPDGYFKPVNNGPGVLLGEWYGLAPTLAGSFPDLKMEIVKIVVNGDSAYFVRNISGTFTGADFFGQTPTGQTLSSISSFLIGMDSREPRIRDLVTVTDDHGVNNFFRAAMDRGKTSKEA